MFTLNPSPSARPNALVGQIYIPNTIVYLLIYPSNFLCLSDDFQLPLGNANVDVEIGNIQDNVQFLLHSIRNHTNRSSPSIHMIPSRIRDLNPRVFNPRQVSLGPLHRKNENLQAFERQKPIFLHDLLRHSGLPLDQTLETCVQKVNASIDRIKECYGDGLKGYSDDEITRMMLMDGCFILEFIYKLFNDSFDENMVIEPMSMTFDLVLIENQIPFFVLQDIFECASSRFKPVASLNELAIRGLVPSICFFDLKLRMKKNEVSNETNHILSFIHGCYTPLCDAEKNPPSDSIKNRILGFIHKSCRRLCDTDKKVVEIIQSPDLGEGVEIDHSSDSDSETYYSAVELDRAGVKFMPHHQPTQWPMDMKLELPSLSWCRPWTKLTLRMPVLGIHNFTELVFRNLIAYEQLSPGRVLHYITSYAIAMDLLIDNQADVARLVKSEVLVNTIGSNEEAAKLINDIRKELCCPYFFYDEVWDEMKKHHNKFWPRNIAWLRRTYFSNPWNIIALLAGIFLFVLTVLQTYFTINPRV